MSAAFIGLDLAKSVFQVHGVDVHGKVVVTKRLRRDGQAATGSIDGREARAIGKAQLVRRANVERARYIERGVRPEHHTGRVEEVEVGLSNRRAQRAVNVGNFAPGDTADHVLDLARSGEGGGLAAGDAEPLKAVEQVV